MGRKPTPTALKKLAGNPGKRPLPKNEPRPTPGEIDRPAHLSVRAAAEWDRLAPKLDKLGLMTSHDLTMFAGYCEAYSLYVQAKDVVQKLGFTYEHNGLTKKRPEVQIMAEQARLMRQYGMEFGLSPSSRSKVSGQIAPAVQPLLPGVPPPARDPAKPDMPPTDLSEDEYFETVRH